MNLYNLTSSEEKVLGELLISWHIPRTLSDKLYPKKNNWGKVGKVSEGKKERGRVVPFIANCFKKFDSLLENKKGTTAYKVRYNVDKTIIKKRTSDLRRVNLYNLFNNYLYQISRKNKYARRFLLDKFDSFFAVMFNDEDIRQYIVKLYDKSQGIKVFLNNIIDLILFYRLSLDLSTIHRDIFNDANLPKISTFQNYLILMLDKEESYEEIKVNGMTYLKILYIIEETFKKAWKVYESKIPLLGNITDIPDLESCVQGRKKMIIWMLILPYIEEIYMFKTDLNIKYQAYLDMSGHEQKVMFDSLLDY